MRSVSCLNGLTLPLKSIFESLAYVNLKVYSFQDHFFIISIESTMWSFRIHLRHVFVFAIACTVQPCSVCGFEVLYQLQSLIFEMEQIQSQPTSELISFLLMIVMELQRRLATQSERPGDVFSSGDSAHHPADGAYAAGSFNSLPEACPHSCQFCGRKCSRHCHNRMHRHHRCDLHRDR